MESLTNKILEFQDEQGCWNVLKEGDPYYPHCNYYVPNYKSTLWTLVFLADTGCDRNHEKLNQPLKIITDHFLEPEHSVFSIGKSHFPIPCLNGNMLYLLSYFHGDSDIINRVVDFFYKYQRFDDGDYSTPSSFPYFSNKSCYGKHTCYWGVVKLLKGLSFIPEKERTDQARELLQKCIDFILLHEVCFSSHKGDHFIHPSIQYLQFPHMYRSDFLEILWLLKREEVHSDKTEKALSLLTGKQQADSSWKVEKPLKNLIVPMGKRSLASEFITERAKEVLDFYTGLAPNRL